MARKPAQTLPAVVTEAELVPDDELHSGSTALGGPTHTRARSDAELVASWLAGMNAPTTRANFAKTADRFLAHLAAHGLTIRAATVEDVRDAMAALADGMAPSTAVQYQQRIKSLLTYAHRLGYIPFNAGAAIKTKGGKVDRAKRIALETEIALLIRAAPTKRDRLLLEVGYAGGLRVSELVSLTWADVVSRADERVQLSVTGKGDKLRYVLLPAIVSRSLLATRGDAPASAPLFPSRKGGAPLYARAVNRMIKKAAERAKVSPAVSAHWLRHAHASHALDRGATVAEVKDTLGHSSVATTSVYLHARPDRSSGLVLDEGIFR
jgi:site-specific recombinase XerD